MVPTYQYLMKNYYCNIKTWSFIKVKYKKDLKTDYRQINFSFLSLFVCNENLYPYIMVTTNTKWIAKSRNNCEIVRLLFNQKKINKIGEKIGKQWIFIFKREWKGGYVHALSRNKKIFSTMNKKIEK